jgi:16S rRNA (uracil1498-N3)-methyltransferase
VPWFIAEPEQFGSHEILLSPEEARHAKVFRLEHGDQVVVTDGRGRVARGPIAEMTPVSVVVRAESVEVRPRPQPQIAVYHAAGKGQKNEDALTKLAGLGAAEVTVFEAARSIVHWDEPKVAKLQMRWSAIARSAAKQSRNPWMMGCRGPLSWTEMAAAIAEETLPVLLWEEEAPRLRQVLATGAARVALIVGPEGGFDPSEVNDLQRAGARTASLGSLILRTENAGPVAAACVAWHYGLIG